MSLLIDFVTAADTDREWGGRLQRFAPVLEPPRHDIDTVSARRPALPPAPNCREIQ